MLLPCANVLWLNDPPTLQCDERQLRASYIIKEFFCCCDATISWRDEDEVIKEVVASVFLHPRLCLLDAFVFAAL